uniref:Uncharacterized protein n=1 Tax=Haptolina ericina TaxID=156174 RepID=A0A7S3AQK1_9EUKA|mmetsp:Transcript_30808/g.69557  ORF Transcript_30808/g.69557 Transcript_30808/m.69557 type:complete len:104 (+) Transcript_30808:685-996(+)
MAVAVAPAVIRAAAATRLGGSWTSPLWAVPTSIALAVQPAVITRVSALPLKGISAIPASPFPSVTSKAACTLTTVVVPTPLSSKVKALSRGTDCGEYGGRCFE